MYKYTPDIVGMELIQMMFLIILILTIYTVHLWFE